MTITTCSFILGCIGMVQLIGSAPGGSSLYFNVDEERLGTVPKLPVPEGNWYKREFRHYGESRGHLHLVEIYGPVICFNVYEMERDYSGWFVKHRVHLDGVGITFPEIVERRSKDEENYSFALLSLVRLEKYQESFLVLHTMVKSYIIVSEMGLPGRYVMLLHSTLIIRA